MHPLGNSINDAREEFWEVPSKAIMVSTDSGASDSPELEKLDGANSFSITAMRFPCWVEFRIYWTRVVFPDPKNPVRMVTGTGSNLGSSVGMVIGILVGVVAVRSLFGNKRGSWRVSSGTSSSLSLSGLSISFGGKEVTL